MSLKYNNYVVCGCVLTQVQALNTSLSDSTTMIVSLKQRLTESQRALASSEQDRRVLQERFDNTRSHARLLRFIQSTDALMLSSVIVLSIYDLNVKPPVIVYRNRSTNVCIL